MNGNRSTQSKCSSFYELDSISYLYDMPFKLQWQIKKSLLKLYHHVYCDPDIDRDDHEMKQINIITERMAKDIKYITLMLTTRREYKEGHVINN